MVCRNSLYVSGLSANAALTRSRKVRASVTRNSGWPVDGAVGLAGVGSVAGMVKVQDEELGVAGCQCQLCIVCSRITAELQEGDSPQNPNVESVSVEIASRLRHSTYPLYTHSEALMVTANENSQLGMEI